MADFDLIIGGAGVSLDTWTDTESPSRLNPHPSHPHKFWKVANGANDVTVSCVLNDGTVAPLDAALGGRLFVWHWVEQHSLQQVGPMAIPKTAGQSSVAAFGANFFNGQAYGHYLLAATRPQGGAVAIPFLVVS